MIPYSTAQLNSLSYADRLPNLDKYRRAGKKRYLSDRIAANGLSTATIKAAIDEGPGTLIWDADFTTDWTASATALTIPSGLAVVPKNGKRLIIGLDDTIRVVNMESCINSVWAVDIYGPGKMLAGGQPLRVRPGNIVACRNIDVGISSSDPSSDSATGILVTAGSGILKLIGIKAADEMARLLWVHNTLTTSCKIKIDLCEQGKGRENALFLVAGNGAEISEYISRCIWRPHASIGATYQHVAAQSGDAVARHIDCKEVGNIYIGKGIPHLNTNPDDNGDADHSSWQYTSGLIRKYMTSINGGESAMVAVHTSEDIVDYGWLVVNNDLGPGIGSTHSLGGGERDPAYVTHDATIDWVTIIDSNLDKEPLNLDIVRVGYSILDTDNVTIGENFFVWGTAGGHTKWGIQSRRSGNITVDPDIPDFVNVTVADVDIQAYP